MRLQLLSSQNHNPGITSWVASSYREDRGREERGLALGHTIDIAELLVCWRSCKYNAVKCMYAALVEE